MNTEGLRVIKYSISELAPVAPTGGKTAAAEHAIESAVDAERFGYHRYWYAEHHHSPGYVAQEAAPLVAAAAQRTSQIRLGAGGALARHYSPFSIAERFLMLEALAPGRIDLGLGRSTGATPLVEIALRRVRESEVADDYQAYVQEVIGYFHHAFPSEHPFASIDLTAGISGVPEVWVLGSSGNTAALAGKLGIGYAFGAQINPEPFAQALQQYRESFTSTLFGSGRPQAMLGLNIVAADDEELAHRLTWPARALHAAGKDRPTPTLAQAEDELSAAEKSRPSTIENGVIPPQISGTPKTLRAQLKPLIEESGATEIIIQDMLTDSELRRRSRELIAEAIRGI